jgi:hypothetical protein
VLRNRVICAIRSGEPCSGREYQNGLEIRQV